MKLHSLKLKLTILVLLIAIVSNLSLMLIARQLSTATVKEAVQHLMDSTTENVASKITAGNEHHFRLLEGLAASAEARDLNMDLKKKCSDFSSIKSINTVYENIAYYTADGDSYTAAGVKINMSSSCISSTLKE
ncbi:hypothetical protein [Treponema sp.]|uniref:hypothetical protein n=1 Tax=Treponema sp. TaxID=166 RepID=UPI0025F9B257|nr:hypothetical protein [Treponema sp.]MCR5217094.1 hypothetical protein [Treponema sp.]